MPIMPVFIAGTFKTDMGVACNDPREIKDTGKRHVVIICPRGLWMTPFTLTDR